MIRIHNAGCAGDCNQGHKACNCRARRFDGTSRPAELDEALPDTPDAAEGVDWVREARIAIGLVAACLVLVLLVHAYASSGAPR